ncbi:hypothetical protein SAMD00019534_123210 [Acytostelium subglobosum LB1]|uniref:hypothetical protein n=1 Tax=Acytostelium subglobosum LB1 TaxID=1410327 RepID=UPI000644BB12|nr:hypothetical protein SAMD00019534_123210 [Acytostelium subglobosum LB1]GAM29145.1 hypothetical protein SAMD00019534_123210 [Acytostelium subglobosum LB1]|eukprot:XP_012747836.1 hypothetical protein SAMD00019534_123210 [Acytostelium subglobosum LB1]
MSTPTQQPQQQQQSAPTSPLPLSGNNNNGAQQQQHQQQGVATPPSTPEPIYNLVNKCLNKLVADSSKRQQQIKEEIRNILETLKAHPNLLTSGSSDVAIKSQHWITVVGQLATIFRLSFEAYNNNTKLILPALEITEKLISSNYITSTMLDENKKPLIDRFLEATLLHCVDLVGDDMALLQVIKLVTLTASKYHKYTLVLSFKTMFYIYVHSKPFSNLSNATKTAITQLLNRLFKQFSNQKYLASLTSGSSSAAGRHLNVHSRSTSGSTSESSTPSSTSTSNTPDLIGGTVVSIQLPAELQSPPTLPFISSNPHEQVADIIDDLIEKVVQDESATDKDSATSSGDSNSNNNSNGNGNLNGNGDLNGPTHTNSPQKVIHPTVSLPVVFDNEKEEYDISLRDAVLVFRLLCELSLREINDYDSPEFRIKTFSLELVSSIFEEYGKYLKNFPSIINYEIREGLYPSILAAAASNGHISIFKQSLVLFMYIALHYREYLKDEVGEFFSLIILRVLENNSSSIQQRWMALQVMSHVCKNSQILIDLYVNYDCSLGSKDIFQRMVEDLSKIAQTVVNDSKPYEIKVKNAGLDCLVSLLKALDDGLTSKKEALQAWTNKHITETQFTKAKELKLKIEEGKAKYKMSPKRGVEFFIKIGVTQREPAALAKFLLDTDGLDKTSTGVYISEREEFNASLLQAYVSLFCFTGYQLDGALRYFLSKFKLAGEAQKIDRVMEAFSKKFFSDNKDSPGFEFLNSDAAYILSFAIVMLNSDLHSTSIKTHMTKAEFIRNNAGINDKRSFEDHFLNSIYDRISKEQLRLQEDDDISELPRLHTQVAFTMEDPSKLVVDTRDLYHHGVLVEQLKTMLSAVWHPILVSLSLVLENTEDSKIVQVCLEGFRCAVNLTSLLTMAIEKEAFVSALANFTNMDKLKELKQKNIECLEKLIQIARADGNYLQKSWLPVLKSISLLERLRNQYLGVNNPNPDSEKNMRKSISTSDFFRLQPQKMPFIAEGITVDNIAKELDFANNLYSNSTSLTNEAIVFFVEALTAVSNEEIKSSTPTFSLLKLVEVAVYNSSRIRLIWQPIADHFTRVGSMPENVYISTLVIDSLKQMAQKFIDLEDVSKEATQKDFLRPLELIFSANAHHDVRELILKCIFQLTNGRYAMIKSGWKPIFTIFTLSSFAEVQIASQAFEFVDELIRDFTYITETFFIDYVNCLSSYANSKHIDLSFKAIDILSYCGVQLANGRVCQLARVEGAEGGNSTLFTDSEQHISLWFPLLTGLARVISHHNDDMRSYALDTLFRVLALFGSTFSPKLWELIFRGVLLPVFDNVGYSKGATEVVLEDTEWLVRTGDRAFKSLTEMFINFIDIICFLLDDMLDLFVNCILQDNELLAKTAGTFLIQLVTHNGNKFTSAQWSSVCQQLHKIFETNTPLEIFDQSALLIISPPTSVVVTVSSTPSAMMSPASIVPESPQKPKQAPLQQQQSQLKMFDKPPSASAPISPLMNGTDRNSSLTSNNTNNAAAETRQQATSLPASPLSLSPAISRTHSAENMSSLDPTDSAHSNHNDISAQSPSTTQQAPTAVSNHSRSYSSPIISSLIEQKHLKKQHKRSSSWNNAHHDLLKTIQSKCSVQLQMVQAINDITSTHYERLNSSQLLCLCDCLDISYHFSQSVFQDEQLKPVVPRIGIILKVLQHSTIIGYLNLLIILYTEQSIDSSTRTMHSEYRLVTLFQDLVNTFITNNHGEIVQTETVIRILKAILQFNDDKFLKNISIFYDKFIQLLLNDDKDIRVALRDILLRVGTLRGTIASVPATTNNATATATATATHMVK